MFARIDSRRHAHDRTRMTPRTWSLVSWPFASRPGSPATGAASGSHVPSPELPPAWLHDHVGTLWRIVARLGVPAHYIDDVLQETFVTVARRRTTIEQGRERAFLIGTATRLSANYRRRAHLRREIQEGEALDDHASGEPDAERLLIRKRLRQRLDRALATLSDAHRAVFVLYELEEMSLPEIAELLGVRLGTATSRLGRARAKFAAAAADLGRDGGSLEDA
jgi:RNA polymerase sigma-70 factor (ECF subfamily)